MNELDKLFSHEEFLQNYVVNRCIGNTGNMHGATVAQEAEKAWLKIGEIVDTGNTSGNVANLNQQIASCHQEIDRAWKENRELKKENETLRHQNLSDPLLQATFKDMQVKIDVNNAEIEMLRAVTKACCNHNKNPALENVLAKLRAIATSECWKHREDKFVMMGDGENSMLTLGDLRRWVESESAA